jgi:hypothetical protein
VGLSFPVVISGDGFKMKKLYFIEYIKGLQKDKPIEFPCPKSKINCVDCFITYFIFIAAVLSAKISPKNEDWSVF